MKRVDFTSTKITGGFWKEWQDTVKNVTVNAVYDRFCDTGRFEAFKFDKNGVKPHIFWDSDVAKWIEGAAYIISQNSAPHLEKIIDELVLLIEKNQDENGYFNIYHTVIEPENRFKRRDNHELYCAGHFIEAAIAYHNATGKSKLLELMLKYVDHIESRFVKLKDTVFSTPGHEEIELALFKLYEHTGDKKHLDLAKFFVDTRGHRIEDDTDYWGDTIYNQSHKPVREQLTAHGHAVRAVYLYCAMADYARTCNDEELLKACKSLFDDITTKKMYVTGGIGSSYLGEAFTVDYDLPNRVSYTETCAAIGLILFANRMLLIEPERKYADVIERALYNGMLSGVSIDGKGFFYTNPLEIMPYMRTRNECVRENHEWLPITQRVEVFECSCCPPNIVRFFPSVANLLYTVDDASLYVHQFMQSESVIAQNGNKLNIKQETNYPYDGRVKITVSGGSTRLVVRIPGWSDAKYDVNENGYACFDVSDGESIELDFEMKPFFVEANPNVANNCAKYAVQNGPIIYCTESIDNGANIRDIRLDSSAEFEVCFDGALNTQVLKIYAYRRKSSSELYYKLGNDLVKFKATLIPYYAFANRGESEMLVWQTIK